MKRTLTFFFTAIGILFSLGSLSAQNQGCPPITVNAASFTGFPCDAVQMVTLPQHNAYKVYLYAATDTINALSIIEVTGSSFPLAAFGSDAPAVSVTPYIIKVVPLSTNMPALPVQYNMTTPPFMVSSAPPGSRLLPCGVIDNVVATRDNGSVPLAPCTRYSNAAEFKIKKFGATITENERLITASIHSYTANPSCLSDTAYLRYLHRQFNAGIKISFRYYNPTIATGNVKGSYLDFAEFKRDQSLPIPYEVFVGKFEGYIDSNVLKLFPANLSTKYVEIEINTNGL